GLLHVRPVLDLHTGNDLKKFRLVANQTSALVRQFKGSLSAEHGVGIARTEYMLEQLGDALLNVMREIKKTFDPKNIFNPAKIFDSPTRSTITCGTTSCGRSSCRSSRGSRSRSRTDRSSAILSNATAAAVVSSKPASCAQRSWRHTTKSCPRAAAPTSFGVRS